MQIDLFILDRPADPLDENVVAPAAFAIHADGDALFFELPGEGFAGELRALIGVEDFRAFIPAEGFFEGLDAERNVHGDRQPPSQHAAAEPIDHRSQIDEAARHGDVADVHGPGLVGPGDGHTGQQIRIDAMAWCGPGGVRPAIDGLDSHTPHQRAEMAATHLQTLMAGQIAQHSAAVKWVVQMQLVDLPHQTQVFGRDRTHDSKRCCD